uniref:AlNc14C261G9813 protein n=1 Tax=Albugo laibachii Nc14 TaxID=890382 RepID=F0WCP5_9STRA|nr:AlNc14C60G4427 [Albugo laibachii Nc14]CCA24834.1 AlNc14C261G9813 [Albugo laibachii Nc14]|eukprot:CCA24834.1 AlNc14C261G9813 [Albugo laibachii Nc14]
MANSHFALDPVRNNIHLLTYGNHATRKRTKQLRMNQSSCFVAGRLCGLLNAQNIDRSNRSDNPVSIVKFFLIDLEWLLYCSGFTHYNKP